jgi:hypothetical protein
MNAAEAEADNKRFKKLLYIIKVVAVGSVCLGAGFLALFYISNFFERLIEHAPGFFENARRGPLFIGGGGFLAGLLHTMAGPDHFVGIMPMVVGQPISTARALFLGALWGSGHAVGQLCLGIGFLALQMGLVQFVDASYLLEHLAKISGFLVGLSLILIGAFGVKEAREFDQAQELSQEEERFGKRSFFIGVFHGLAPDSMIFLAPALALPRLAAILHVSGVFIGTLFAMAFCSAALKNLCRKAPKLNYISGGASIAAMLLGTGFILASAFGVKIPFLPA